MLKKLYVFFILLVSVEFFTLSFIGEELQKNLEALAIISLVLLITAKFVTNPIRIKDSFYKEARKGIIIILIAVFLSSFSALWFYQQPLKITLIAQRSMYFYLLFFFLYQYKIDIKYLEKLLLFMGILFSIVYLSAIFSPDIVTAKILEERGTFRIGLTGIIYINIGLFYSLEQIIYYKKKVYFFIAFLFLSNILITGTRSIIGITFLLSIIYLYQSFKSKKILSVILAISIFFIGGILFYSIIDFVLLLYKKALSGQEGNLQIRFTALSLIVSEFFKNIFTYFIGNGFASENSNYGLRLLYLKENYGVYQSDLGIIGDYTKYGLIYLIAIFYIIKLVISNKKYYLNTFMLYSFYYIIFTMILLSHFGTQSHIPAIVIIFYLLNKRILIKQNETT